MGKRNLLSALSVLGLFIVAADASSGEPPDSPELFIEVRPDEQPVPADGRYHETFAVRIDMEAMQQPAQRLRLNLPDQEPDIVELQYWSPRQGYIQIADPDDPSGLGTITIPDPNARPEDFHWHWYGRSERHTVALTVVAGVLAGRVSAKTRRYALIPTGVGRARLGRVNSAFWRTHPDDPRPKAQAFTPPRSAGVMPAAAPGAARPGLVPAPQRGGWDSTCSDPLSDGQHVIDVLLLYTQGMLNRYLGDVSLLHAQLRSTLDDANVALRNSGIFNVVFSPRGPEFLPNPPAPDDGYDAMDIEDALHTLAGVEEIDVQPILLFPGNPYVLGRRNAQWADIVALARVDSSNFCGVSYGNNIVVNNGYVTEPGPAFEKLAYLIYDPDCNADQLNLAHELGHQLGMEHDPGNFEGVTYGHLPSCPWSYGHKRSSGDAQFRFRTVMAYWQDSNWQSGGPPSCGNSDNCPQIEAYSTPLLEWANGLHPVNTVSGASAIGVAPPGGSLKPAYAADTIRRIAPIVQGYRPRPEAIFSNGFQ